VAQLHLIIAGKLICWKVIQTLWQTTSAPPYQCYLKVKFNWTASDMDNIYWEVLSMSMKSFHSEDQCCLVLFINDKLPLCASKAHLHYGLKSALCVNRPETKWHFLECTHPTSDKLFQNLKNSLTQLAQKLWLHLCILTTVWLGLVAIRTDTKYPLVLQDLPQPLHASIRFQHQLGWDQVYHGQVSAA